MAATCDQGVGGLGVGDLICFIPQSFCVQSIDVIHIHTYEISLSLSRYELKQCLCHPFNLARVFVWFFAVQIRSVTREPLASSVFRDP